MPEIGQTLSHFRIVQKIGEGGMGEVYLADDTTLDRKVALKFLPEAFTSDPERMARFEREAKLLASLNHPNIAGIYGLEQADGNRFLVLEYVEGETLQARLSKGALPLEDALDLCRQVAEGLEAAHEKGVIHRDLKPANVMITADEKVKILDFGLAKALLDETQSIDSSQSPTLTEAMTRPGVILGTAAYMSPEQAKGKSVDKRADIWAFGCILYECLAGKKAFEGETITETLAAVIKEEPDFGFVPSRIQLLLSKCLAKDRKNRLRDIGDAMIWTERPLEIVKAAPVKRSRLSWITAAVFILAFAYISVIHFRKEQPTPFHPMSAKLVLPEDAKLAPGGFFSFSPDGRHLAFVGVDSEGTRSLWILDLNSIKSRPLRGTESQHAFPFIWSPDGQSIAFDSGNKLKIVDIKSGVTEELCDLQGIMVGGSWNREGVIIFGMFGQDMMKVSVKEGSPSLLVKCGTKTLGQAYMPTFLPDGRHFLYSGSGNSTSYAILIGDLNSKPEDQAAIPLVENAINPIYIPSRNSNLGYLLFLSAHTLMMQQFDEKKLKTVGEARVVAEQVKSFESYYGFFSTSTNGALIYQVGGAYQLTQGTVFNRNGKVIGEYSKVPGTFSGAAFSSDGKQAVISWTKSETSIEPNIYLWDLEKKTSDQFTAQVKNRRNPLWSHDGKYIIYTRNDEDKYNLYIKPSSGLEEESLLYSDNDHQFASSLSNDGRFVLCSTYDRRLNRSNLTVLDRKEKPYDLTPLLQHPVYTEFDGHFSPDMKWIAYTSNESGSTEVYVAQFFPASESEPPKMSDGKMVSKGKGGMGPRWSVNDDKLYLYYRSFNGDVMVVEFMAEDTSFSGDSKVLFKAERDLTTVSLVFNHPTWDVSTDGRLFFLITPVIDSSANRLDVIFNWTSLLDK